jgi:large subunit ribosomal protein L25
MVANATLNARARGETGKSAARKIRAAGRIPAVLYGHGEDTRHLSVDVHEVQLLFSRISVENTIITLNIEGDRSGEVRALVREVQIHPSSRELRHVDFHQIHAGESVHVEIPIRFLGTAEGARLGGIFLSNIDDLPIRCLAEQIPEAVEVDVTGLNIGDSIHVRDLDLPATVQVELDGDVTVCSVTHPTVAALETEPEVPESAALVEPEVIRRRGEGVDDVPRG